MAYAAHCQRLPIDRRPTLWASFSDIWGEACGELSTRAIPKDFATLAVLTPFILVPTIAEASFVADETDLASRRLALVSLAVSSGGLTVTHRSVSYEMDDSGVLSFGESLPGGVRDPLVRAGLGAAVAGRADQTWADEWSYEAAVRVAVDLLDKS